MDFLPLLAAHVYSAPFYIIWLGGIIYAIVMRQRHPRTSLFAGLAFGILLLVDLVAAILTAYTQSQALGGDLPATELGTRLGIISLCSLPISVLGWLLLLAAIFVRKDEHA